jgi:ribosomal protein L22
VESAAEKPKAARKPRAAKAKPDASSPKVDEASAASSPEVDAPVEEKPKPARKPRAAKPKAQETAAADAPVAASSPKVEVEAVVEEPKAEKAAKVEKPAKPEAAKPGKPAAPKSRTARRGHDDAVAAPVVRAQAKYVRSSARKARLVCDNIRGKSVEDARAILAHTPRAVAKDWSKLLESAVANAEHNHELVGEDLVIKAVQADEGPTIKRFRPRAMGRATQIRKRTSHLTILLTPKN